MHSVICHTDNLSNYLAIIMQYYNKFNNILALVCFVLRLACKSSETMKKAEALSYFTVEILYEGIFGHMTTFWMFTYVNIVLTMTTANIPITN